MLSGNKFSVLTKGLLGSDIVLQLQESVTTVHDPLMIARDYVKYSQLDAAIATLKSAVIEYPDRQDIQNVLELNRATNNSQSFTKMQGTLIEKELDLSDGWWDLACHFVEMSNER